MGSAKPAPQRARSLPAFMAMARMRERAVPLTLLTATLGFKIHIKRQASDCFQFGREFMNVKRLSIGLVIGAFVFVTLAPLFSAAAFAQRDCGPNSNKCKTHHESCTC